MTWKSGLETNRKYRERERVCSPCFRLSLSLPFLFQCARLRLLLFPLFPHSFSRLPPSNTNHFLRLPLANIWHFADLKVFVPSSSHFFPRPLSVWCGAPWWLAFGAVFCWRNRFHTGFGAEKEKGGLSLGFSTLESVFVWKSCVLWRVFVWVWELSQNSRIYYYYR